MTGSERGYAHRIDAKLIDMGRNFGSGFEQIAHMHDKTQIGKSRGNDLGPAIVPVLPHLGDEDRRAAAARSLEAVDAPGDSRKLRVIPVALGINA